MTISTLAPESERIWRATWRLQRWGLPAVLLLYLLLGLVWTFSVPLGEGPDEPAHFDYALYLLREGRLPVATAEPASTDVSGEAHQPPLAYLLMQPFVAWLDDPALPRLYGNPGFRWSGGQEPNAFLHGLRDRPPYRGVALAWHLTRLLSLALGAISIALCYVTARLLWPAAPGLALGAAALVAFNPQWIFHHALVSNDPLLIALSSLLICLSVGAAEQLRQSENSIARTFWSRVTSRWWLLPQALGIVLGLMLITKQSALFLAPVPLLGLYLGRRSIARWLMASALVLMMAVVISAWWFVRNRSLYGDLMGVQTFQTGFQSGDFRLDNWQAWREGTSNLLRSSWGLFGWMTVGLPDGAYALVRTLLLVAAVGLLASVGRRIWRGNRRGVLVLMASAALMLIWVAIFGLTAHTVAWPGRFLFPAMPAWSLLLAAGLAHALPRRIALTAAVLVSLLTAALLPTNLIRPLYGSPAVAAAEVPKDGPYARFDYGFRRGLELHDATFDRTVRSGTTMPIGLTWHVVDLMDRSYTVFIHLVDEHEEIVAHQNALAVDGKLPMSQWVPGDWFRDNHELALEGVPPGTYRLRVGLYDPKTHLRVRVYDRDGELTGDFLDLGEVRVLQ
jgi:hypothetical protein